MRKINKMDVLRLVLVLALVAGIGLAFGSVGRFVPTHKIVQPVYCGSCHPEQVVELSATTHLGKFSEEIESWLPNTNGTGPTSVKESAYPNARIISGACVMCHNYWENMKWYGVRNFALESYDSDNPSITSLAPPTDIYGNEVSPYGLGSTKQWYMNTSMVRYGGTTGIDLSAEPWQLGLDNYSYTDADGNHSRLDYVWSALSAKSPGPIGWVRRDSVTGAASSCAGGTVEHGLCHIAASAVVLAYSDKKNEVMDYPNDNISTTGFTGTTNARSGKGIFFTHEMAFTTAQYAAKPVKICGACHVLKLPPMQWGGEPWSIAEVKAFSAGTTPTDPFGFRPTYNDLTAIQGEDMVKEHNYNESTGNTPFNGLYANLPVAFRTPDWAHANVPCIRCHVHAGVNGETVSNNAGE